MRLRRNHSSAFIGVPLLASFFKSVGVFTGWKAINEWRGEEGASYEAKNWEKWKGRQSLGVEPRTYRGLWGLVVVRLLWLSSRAQVAQDKCPGLAAGHFTFLNFHLITSNCVLISVHVCLKFWYKGLVWLALASVPAPIFSVSVPNRYLLILVMTVPELISDTKFN